MNRICLFLLMGVLVMPHLILASSTAEDNARNGDRAGALIKRLDQNVIVQTIKSLIDLTGSSFKSGFEASVRSIFNKPLTTAVYAISMLIGAVAMLSFYESPISPIPVPPLPDPPVGRFPPEHSVWPPAGEGQPLGFPGLQNKRNSAGYQGAASILNPQFVLAPQQGVMHGQQQANQQGFYPMYGYNNEHHRSDKMPAAVASSSQSSSTNGSGSQNSRPNAKSAEKAQEAAYNEYISKLTAQLNQQQQALAAQEQAQPQYDPSLYQNIDQTNKIIDYSNKRMSVDNVKFQGLNNSTQNASA